MQRRFAMVLMDSAADEPLAALDGRTPLEAAPTPHCDEIARRGRQGSARTIPAGFHAAPDAALVSWLGFDPRRRYTGLGPLEAAGSGLRLAADEIVFRCNLVTVGDGRLLDITAGHIQTAEAMVLLNRLNTALVDFGARFVAGESYRHLMVLKNAADFDLSCTPAYGLEGEPVAEHRARGRGSDRVREVIHRAEALLKTDEINVVRRDMGENPANSIWLWGGGRMPRWRRFRERYGLIGVAVGATAAFRGIASLVGLLVTPVVGATGRIDTNYAAKGRAAMAALAEHELVVVHVQSPAEATLSGSVEQKVEAIARIDREIVGPVYEAVRQAEHHAMIVAATITGCVEHRRFRATPPPFCIAGTSVEQGGRGEPFGESAAARSDLYAAVAWEMMEHLLRR